MMYQRIAHRVPGVNGARPAAASLPSPAVRPGVSLRATAVGVLCLLVVATAVAADSLEAERDFHVIDRDADGAITPAEARRSTRYSLFPYVFDAVDLDGSGAVEYREWDRARFYMRSLDAGGLGDAG